VAHFEIDALGLPVENLWKALNRELPDDIRLIASTEVNDDFHSRFAATNRAYLYQITTLPNVLQRSVQWHVRYSLDIAQLHELAELITGEHDFSSFCYAGTETENMICNIASARWEVLDAGVIHFKINADRFLHHMVRMLVGSMIEVARGKWDIDKFSTLLKTPNRQAHTVTAPAKGLVLVEVRYPQNVEPQWEIAKDELV